jgi:hypothetical protein
MDNSSIEHTLGLNRRTLPVAVSGNPAKRLVQPGYLYGTICKEWKFQPHEPDYLGLPPAGQILSSLTRTH